jgi:hypothetical protein
MWIKMQHLAGIVSVKGIGIGIDGAVRRIGTAGHSTP